MHWIRPIAGHHAPPGHVVGIGALQNAAHNETAKGRIAKTPDLAVGGRPPERDQADDVENPFAGAQLRTAAMRGLGGATSTWALVGTMR